MHIICIYEYMCIYICHELRVIKFLKESIKNKIGSIKHRLNMEDIKINNDLIKKIISKLFERNYYTMN